MNVNDCFRKLQEDYKLVELAFKAGKITKDEFNDTVSLLFADLHVQIIDDGIEALVKTEGPEFARDVLESIKLTVDARLDVFDERYVNLEKIYIK